MTLALPLPLFNEIISRLGGRPGRNNRAACVIHDGKNPSSLSWHEGKGVFYCHTCHAKGDKIALVMLALKISFKQALAWLGVDTSRPFKLDPPMGRQHQTEQHLRVWSSKKVVELKEEVELLKRIEVWADEKFLRDPDDPMAWNWLEFVYKNESSIENVWDALVGASIDELREIRRAMEGF